MNSSEINKVWAEFEQFENSSRNLGRKRLVPIIGSGFNIQAFPNSYNWQALLIDVAKSIGISTKTKTNFSTLSMTSIWEKMVIHTKNQKSLPTLKAENLEKRDVLK